MSAIAERRRFLARRRARREADSWLRRGFESRFPWRVAELTSTRERERCARSLRGVLGELNGSKLPGATPLRRGVLLPHTELLEAIEERLLDGKPVSARGMLAVNELLTSADSCLFAPADDIESCLRGVLAKLKTD
jgi:hypothetical protein